MQEVKKWRLGNMKLNTKRLKQMLSELSRCKPSKMLEISNYYEISLSSEGIVLKATDGLNFILVTDTDSVYEDDVKITVRAEQFKKLIDKTTTETIALKVDSISNSFMEVKGNGKHKVEVYQAEEYPTFHMNSDCEYYKIATDKLIHALRVGASAVSSNINDSLLLNYLVRDGVLITADAIKIAYSPIEELEMNILIPPNLGNLIMGLKGEQTHIYLYEEERCIIFKSGDTLIYGGLSRGVSEYPPVEPLFEEEQPYNTRFKIIDMLQAIDRLQLFMGQYDNDMISINMNSDCITLETKGGSIESVGFTEPLNEEVDLVYTINATYFKDLLKSMIVDEVEFGFGDGECLKFRSNEDLYILALCEGVN